MKKIFILLIFLSLFSSVNALSFVDNFSSYSNYYTVLTDTNLSTGWTIASDANAPVVAAPLIGRASVKVPVDVSLNADNNAGISRVLDQNFNLTDYNSLGRIYTMISLDSNTTFSNVILRMGQSSSKYFQWTNSSPYGDTFYLGKNLVEFDFNSSVVKVGSPTVTDINYVQLVFSYSAGQGDFNVWVDRVWLEKSGNAFNGTWDVLIAGNHPDGWAIPFSYPEGNGLSLTDINKTSLGNHGRVFVPQFDSINLGSYDIDWTIDLNQVDTNWGTRMLFDFVDGDDFSACYVFDATSTSRRVGIEQWVNNTRTFDQATLTMRYGDYNSIRCSVSNNTTSVYVNGILIVSGSFFDRMDGRIGLESFGGISHIKNSSMTLTVPATYHYNTTTNTIADNMLPLFGMIILFLMIIIGFIMAIRGEFSTQNLLFLIGLMLTVIGLLILSIIFKIVSTTI